MLLLIFIIIIALFIGLFFLIVGISLGGYIYNGTKGNGDLQKKCLKILIPSAIVWFLLILINIVLIIIFLYGNGGVILDYLTQFIQNLRN